MSYIPIKYILGYIGPAQKFRLLQSFNLGRHDNVIESNRTPESELQINMDLEFLKKLDF